MSLSRRKNWNTLKHFIIRWQRFFPNREPSHGYPKHPEFDRRVYQSGPRHSCIQPGAEEHDQKLLQPGRAQCGLMVFYRHPFPFRSRPGSLPPLGQDSLYHPPFHRDLVSFFQLYLSIAEVISVRSFPLSASSPRGIAAGALARYGDSKNRHPLFGRKRDRLRLGLSDLFHFHPSLFYLVFYPPQQAVLYLLRHQPDADPLRFLRDIYFSQSRDGDQSDP